MARRPVRGLTAAAALLALLAGCGRAAAPAAGPPATPPVAATASATPGSPDAVALAATTAWLSYDTRVDHRPNDTARRLALPWLAPALQQDVTGFASASGPGAEWEGWAARHARATVAARLAADDHPPDADGAAWRQVDATITLRGDGDWTTSVTESVFVRLGLVDGRWRVTDLQAARS